MRYLLATFGVGNPDIHLELPDHAVYPVATETGAGLDLDYTALLVGNSFVIDRASLDYIEEHVERLPFLRTMRTSLRKLRAEGILEVFDGPELIRVNSQSIGAKTDFLLEQFDPWLEAMRIQWADLKADRERFIAKYGASSSTTTAGHFTVANALYKRTGLIDRERTQAISDRILDADRPLGDEDLDLLRDAARPLITHIVIQDLFRYATSSLVLDWDDSAKYYDNLYRSRWEVDIGAERDIFMAARKIFDVTLPRLRPNNVDAVIKFIRGRKNVSSLRSTIICCLGAGEEFDVKWAAEYLAELIRAELVQKRKMRRLRFSASAAGLALPGGSLAVDLLAELGTSAAERAADAAMPPASKPYWLYALLGNV